MSLFVSPEVTAASSGERATMDETNKKNELELADILENRKTNCMQHTDELISSILKSYEDHPISTRLEVSRILNRDLLIDVLEKIRQILFPGYFDENRIRAEYLRFIIGEKIEYIQYHLSKQVSIALEARNTDRITDRKALAEEADRIVDTLLGRIPAIREVLATDIQAFYDGDPAAYSFDEIILSYPGLMAISVYRIAHELWELNVPLIPRIMTEYAHGKTGIDIHPGAKIGRYFFIDHGTGIVIGETTVIGEHVKMYQGVTLGGLSTRKGQGLKGVKRHPTIGDNVTIYSGTSVLGGETVIGENVTIGGNTFIVRSIPADMKVNARPPELEYSIGPKKDKKQ